MFVWYTFISNHLKIGCLKILQLRKKKAFKKVVLKSAILICHFNTLFLYFILYFINRNFLRIFLTLFFYNNQSLE